jgi:hypothetical protein
LVFSTLNGVKATPSVPDPVNPTLGARLIPADRAYFSAPEAETAGAIDKLKLAEYLSAPDTAMDGDIERMNSPRPLG